LGIGASLKMQAYPPNSSAAKRVAIQRPQVLRLDAAGRAAAIETITNPPDVDCVTNDWVPEMYAYLEAGLGRVLPNLEIDRTPAGYQHAGGFAG